MIDHDLLINDKIRSLKPSGIRRFFDIAVNMKDVISLSIGEPDFSTPWHIRKAGIDSLDQGKTWYTPNGGLLELRKEITDYFLRRFGVKYHYDFEILITVGCSEAIDLCIRTLVENGDEVIIPQPSFVCYEPLVRIAGGVPVLVDTKEDDEFKLTPHSLQRAITPKTKLLILPYPNNPTGAVMNEDDLNKIADIIKDTNIIVLSDEIYAELTYGEEGHTPFSKLQGMRERTIIVSGFSKSYAMTGWRLGYALGPETIISNMTKLHQYSIMSASTTAQYAAIEAIKAGDSDIESMKEQYDIRRRFILDAFREIGFSCFEPKGAFYVFPCIKSTGLSSEEFCERLILEKHVAVIPGNAFGNSGEGFIRVSYSYSLKHIKEALILIEDFLNDLKAGRV